MKKQKYKLEVMLERTIVVEVESDNLTDAKIDASQSPLITPEEEIMDILLVERTEIEDSIS